MTEPPPYCYICFGEDAPLRPSPCACKTSVVHLACLDGWRENYAQFHCGACKQPWTDRSSYQSIKDWAKANPYAVFVAVAFLAGFVLSAILPASPREPNCVMMPVRLEGVCDDGVDTRIGIRRCGNRVDIPAFSCNGLANASARWGPLTFQLPLTCWPYFEWDATGRITSARCASLFPDFVVGEDGMPYWAQQDEEGNQYFVIDMKDVAWGADGRGSVALARATESGVTIVMGLDGDEVPIPPSENYGPSRGFSLALL